MCAGKTTRQVRYSISSLAPDAQSLAESVRTHWSIENPLHWVLDVAFREDESRIRSGHAPENFTLLEVFSPECFESGAHSQSGGQKQASSSRMG